MIANNNPALHAAAPLTTGLCETHTISGYGAGPKTYEDGIRAAMEKIDNLRIAEAGEFDNPRCRGQRGQDRSDALYDAYQILKCMLPDPAQR